jgi:selenocysteine lyase/cysteine desulfurase
MAPASSTRRTSRAPYARNTRLVVVNHASNVIGTVAVGAIGRVCRERGVLVVDASQTAGVVPIDMRAMNIDALVFTGHKAPLGSTGIGGLCVRQHPEVRQGAPAAPACTPNTRTT